MLLIWTMLHTDEWEKLTNKVGLYTTLLLVALILTKNVPPVVTSLEANWNNLLHVAHFILVFQATVSVAPISLKV